MCFLMRQEVPKITAPELLHKILITTYVTYVMFVIPQESQHSKRYLDSYGMTNMAL